MEQKKSLAKAVMYFALASVCMYILAVSHFDPRELNANLLRWGREALSMSEPVQPSQERH